MLKDGSLIPALFAASPIDSGPPEKSSKIPKILKVLHGLTNNLCDEITLEPIFEEVAIDSLLVTKGFDKTQFSFGLEIALDTFLSLQNVKAICRHIDFALAAILGAPTLLLRPKQK
ncbi:hypothetical protein BOTNAR_0548g00010 [Botryotinia narcissicola]|uniref:Uncharacterized protein n=1 Tax=Botryotinia narcissicola TaxID=278944 RepID=A0A4Z1HQE5_9HELO|nr:hypothetical protein BOTNAR_0548g00010 [Botryotinia narcissicola]